LPVPVSQRVQKVKPSPTLAMTARAAKLKAEGKDIIGLAAGEPDFDTPVHISDAGVEAIRKGVTRYTAVDGTTELKDAIIGKFKRDNALTYERAQILVSSGAKQTCFNACLALLDPGDECVIPAPYWVSYPDMALLADGVPVSVYAGPAQGYKITAAQLAAAYENPESLSTESLEVYFDPFVDSEQRREQLKGFSEAERNRDQLVAAAKGLHASQIPAQVLWGDADTAFDTPASIEWLKSNLGGLRKVITIPKAKLFWPEEHPRLLTVLLKEFWSGLD